ncbi:hypothetical protein Barb7_00024 [Bacteroidales bacterium Barb7]|nr:hypothetical protein Barb7_00079 [Bacteroidales bacterium Barb7]OAV76310.1 hypothetical protein Barb7_00024 [Bacteroidales bacterium Barb7]
MKDNLEDLISVFTESSVELGKESCTNLFSDTIYYIVQPIDPTRDIIFHTAKSRLTFLKKNRLLDKHGLVAVIAKYIGKIIWVDFRLFRSEKDRTIIHVKLIKGEASYPQFHACVEIHPSIALSGSKEKFDLNWQFDDQFDIKKPSKFKKWYNYILKTS